MTMRLGVRDLEIWQIAPAPTTPHTAPTAPGFSARSGGLGVRGFYIIMWAWHDYKTFCFLVYFDIWRIFSSMMLFMRIAQNILQHLGPQTTVDDDKNTTGFDIGFANLASDPVGFYSN